MVRGTNSNDQSDESVSETWLVQLKHGLCLPTLIVENAWNSCNPDIVKLLRNILDWITRRIDNKDEYNLPVFEWEAKLNKFFPDIPDAIKTSAKGSFSDDKYGEWRHLICCILRLHIDKLKSDVKDEIELSEVSEATEELRSEVENKSGSDDVCHISNMKNKPIDFVETYNFKEMLQFQENRELMQIFGERLVGKSYSLNGLLHRVSLRWKVKLQPSVIWQFQCKEVPDDDDVLDGDDLNHGTVIREGLENLLNQLKGQLLSAEEVKELMKSQDQLAVNLIKLLHHKKVNVLFAFDDVGEGDKKAVREIMDFICSVERHEDHLIQIVITSHGKNAIYNEVDTTSRDMLWQWKVTGFSKEESETFLQCGQSSAVVCYQYLADQYEMVHGNLYDGTEALAEYFHNNPGCLKVAKTYCISRRVSYKQYLDAMKEKSSRQFLRAVGMELMKNANEDDAKAYMALYKLVENDEKVNEATARLEKIMKILRYVNNEDIPIFFIGKLCQHLRPNNKQLTGGENAALNNQEASDAVCRMEETIPIHNKSHNSYPNGGITIRKDVFDAMAENEAEDTTNLIAALSAMAGMTSKDNTERSADIKLYQLKPHINSLAKHAWKYLRNNTDNKRKETFNVTMLVCRLYELLGQAMIQGRVDMDIALKHLIYAVSLVWDVANSYAGSGFFLFCGISKSKPLADALAYKEGKVAENEGKRIAKLCIDAGMQVKPKYLEDYLLSSLFLNKRNLSHFVENTMETLRISEEEAKEKLDKIEELVFKGLPCEPEHLEILRETGNLLKHKELQQTFFAERITSILHTYGRQVLYLQDPDTGRKCEYYRDLANSIAKAVRKKTKVALLNEYLTVANSFVPRLLQNRDNESREEWRRRLKEARRQSEGLLVVVFKYFENGCYRKVSDTAYTKLNAIKYIVKTNTKMMKHLGPADLPANAWDRCRVLMVLAKDNCSLDMASHIMIQAGKFFAATSRFQEAFDAFKNGFRSERDGVDTGVLNLKDWRPDTVAWAVNNYCMAVHAYGQQETHDGIIEKRVLAHEYCRHANGSEKVKEHWKVKMTYWMQEFDVE